MPAAATRPRLLRAAKADAPKVDAPPRLDLSKIDPAGLSIVKYPDPRLRRVSRPLADGEFTPALAAIVARMFVLMREANGVGLAAPQVGLNVRLFVMNPTGDPADDAAYANPVLLPHGEAGDEEADEGCLSLPNVTIPVLRSKNLRLTGRDPITGDAVDVASSGFPTRVWQHEADHLDGVMLIDKMGPVGKLTFRKTLKEMEEAYGA